MSIGRGRRIDRIALVSVILIGTGGALWCWPEPDVISQVGPKVPMLSTPPASGSPTITWSRPSAGRSEMTRESAVSSVTGAGEVTQVRPPTSTGARTPRPGHNLTRAHASRPLPAGPTRPAPRVTRAPVASSETSAVPVAVPATIIVPFASANHPDGVSMTVIPHGPTAGGQMWIPGPEEGMDDWADAVSWLNSPGYAAPFSSHGAVIIAGHINWGGTPGALSDLAEYGADDIGRPLTVTMTDGRVRKYRIVAGLAIDKAALAAESNQGPLHTAMFGQLGTYGSSKHPTEELRIISCGGQYDPAARSYDSNIMIIARPVP